MGRKKELVSNCDESGGKLMPVVDFNKCDRKEDCVVTCSYDIFEMRPISKEEKSALNFVGKLKTLFNKNKAYLNNPESCHACGLCIQVCPEKAIKLTRYH